MTWAVRAVAALAAVVVAGCGPVQQVETTRRVGVDQAPIVGGVLDTGDPAVVALSVKHGAYFEQYCTGTLVGQKTVLTAAHCINAYGANNAYYVVFAPDTTLPNVRAVRVAQQVAHPDYSAAGTGNDFGLVKLSTAVTDITPIPLNGTAMDNSWVGRDIRHAGYGVTNGTNHTGSGIKREVTYQLRQVTAMEIESGTNGKQTCNGDSGGPAFMVLPGETTERVVGVVSWGDQNCSYQGWDGRVDFALASWIEPTMNDWEHPSCSTGNGCVPGCTPVDQDCVCVADGVCSAECLNQGQDPDCPRDCVANGVCATQACGVPDPDCKAVGTPCAYVEQCFARACISDPQHVATYCSKTCATKADCPEAMECTNTQCTFPQLPNRSKGERCTLGEDFCVSTTCSGPLELGAVTRCVQACVGNPDCPPGQLCEPGANNTRFCRDPAMYFVTTSFRAAPALEGDAAVLTLTPTNCSATGGPALTLLALAVLSLRRKEAR